MRWQLASTFAFTAMSAACYAPNTVVCPHDVLCPKGEACTGNTTGNLCGDEAEVAQCAETEHALCTRAKDVDEDGQLDDGLCVDKLCAPCAPELFECRYDSWTPMGASPAPDLASVFVETSSKAAAVGNFGKVITYDGAHWMPEPDVPNGQNLTGVWTVDDHTYSVSFNGNAYRDTTLFVTANPQVSLRGIWGASASDVIVVGVQQTLGEFNGSGWTWITGAPFQSLNDVYGVDGVAIVVGSAGEVRRRISGTWTTLPQVGPPGAPDELLGVWAANSDAIFVVGRSGAQATKGVIYRFTGSTWEPQQIPDGTPRINAVWGANENEVYAVGEDGIVLSFIGGVWTSTKLGTSRLKDISGSGRDAIAVGADGSLWRISPR